MPASSRGLANTALPAEAPSAEHRLRIAYVVYTFEIGGIERSVARLASRLDRRQFQPCIICLDRNGQAAGWIETDDVPILELHKRPRNDLGVVFRLARALRERQIDIVNSHNWGTLVETTLARRWAGVPVHIHSERGTVLGDVDVGGLRGRVRALAMRWAVGSASALVSNAVAVGRRAAAFSRLPEERVTIIPNGLDAPRHRAGTEAALLRKGLGIPADAVLVGSVGRLAAVKNFAIAIEAIGLLASNGCNAHLVLVGDGPERSSLTERARALGIADRVYFAGWHEDVTDWLAAMDVYVNCSLSEGMSQSLVEAMAAGRPLVVTDVGDNGLLAAGERECGFVVPSGDVARLSAEIGRLAADSALRDRLGENARERFECCYSAQRMVSRYESLYLEQLRAAPRRGASSRSPIAGNLP